MLADRFADFTSWTTWLTVGVGITLTVLVIGIVVLFARWRGRRWMTGTSTEEDLPWEDLLELIRARKQKRVAEGVAPYRGMGAGADRPQARA